MPSKDRMAALAAPASTLDNYHEDSYHNDNADERGKLLVSGHLHITLITYRQ